jgi:hypothetical protein
VTHTDLVLALDRLAAQIDRLRRTVLAFPGPPSLTPADVEAFAAALVDADAALDWRVARAMAARAAAGPS